MLKIPSVENWRKIVSRGKYPMLFIYELSQGLLNSHKVTGLDVKMTNYCRVGGNTYFAEKQTQKFTEKVREVLRKKPRETLIWIKEYFKLTKELFDWIFKINKKSPQTLSKKELKKLYKDYTDRTQIIWRWGYLPFLIDNAIEAELNNLLVKLRLEPKQIPEAIKTLSVTSNLTLFQKEHIELLKLVKKIKKEGMKKIEKEINHHLMKWVWKNSWIYNQHTLTIQQLKNEIAVLLKDNLDKLLRELTKEHRQQLANKKKFLAKFKNRKLEILAKILSEYKFWHSYKMEEMTKAIYLLKPFLEELAKKFNLSYEQFTELAPKEVEKEKINLKIINDRVKDNGVLILNGKRTILTPAQTEMAKKKIEAQPANLKEFRGFTVYKGRVTGKVVIVSVGKVDVTKIKIRPGDILVTTMTSTNMVPLAKKSLAIITDEGGLLCHAAIIARELKTPCIIGTKIATKVLKDGDLVEVDANRGWVKILRK